MIEKNCPICSKNNFQYSNSEKDLILERERPKLTGASYVYDLWHNIFDFCPNCYFSCLNFDDIKEIDKNFINSKGFNNLTDNSKLEFLENLITPTYKPYLYGGYYYEKNSDNFLASISYFKASENLLTDILQWKQEIADELTNDEEKCLNYCYSLKDELIRRAIEQIDIAISNNNNVDFYMFKAVILISSEQQYAAKDILENALNSNFNLTSNQIDAINFLKKGL